LPTRTKVLGLPLLLLPASAQKDIANRNKSLKRLRERKEETVPKKVKDKKVKLDMEAERESPKEEGALLLDRKTRSREKEGKTIACSTGWNL